ncbi:MAG: HPt (histidine-containing phosphotransfer) domain-containing protein [Crocinitomicaceae bacterium]|jgi:HPt (histidine-containing phosphotransfer) domain-containing protein
MANLELLEMPELMSLADGDEEFVLLLLDLFIESANDSIASLENDASWENLVQVSHKLEPSLLILNLDKLKTAAYVIRDSSTSHELVDEMKVLLAEGREIIKNKRGQLVN